jgi:serine-type D-Ala-D-Ala endopeptidase (penicillin-binding protein 7)
MLKSCCFSKSSIFRPSRHSSSVKRPKGRGRVQAFRRPAWTVVVAGTVFVAVFGVERAFAQSASARKPTTSQRPPAPKTTLKPATSAATKPTMTTRAAVNAKKKLTVSRRAAIAQQQLREAETLAWKRDAAGNLVPDVRAAAAIVFNPQTGEVVLGQNMHEQRSIASLTKVMTALTFVQDNPDLSQVVSVTRADVSNASVTYLKAGDRVSYYDLLHLALIASDNAAARVLARTSEGGTAAFVSRMNETAIVQGLTNTHYVDPSGLDARNVSSAYDLAHLINAAATDSRLGAIMRTAEYAARAGARFVDIHSTNRLLSMPNIEVLAGKTGFISKAGYCLATVLQVPQGSQLAVVVLGAANSAMRFGEARNLLSWIVGKNQGIVGGN